MDADVSGNLQEPVVPKKKRKWLWIGITAGLLAICGIAIAVVLLYFSQVRKTAEANRWGPEYSTPGTQLTLVEVGRVKTQNGTGVTYSVTTTGLSASQTYELSFRNFPDEAPIARGNYRVDAAGHLLHADTGQLLGNITMGQYAKGQAFYMALMSPDGKVKVFSKSIPFPIEVTNGSGCRLSVELMSRDGTSFNITAQGLQPNETVRVEDHSENESMSNTNTADANGKLNVFELPAVVGKQSGSASYRIIGKGCDLTVQYQWGPPALQIQ